MAGRLTSPRNLHAGEVELNARLAPSSRAGICFRAEPSLAARPPVDPCCEVISLTRHVVDALSGRGADVSFDATTHERGLPVQASVRGRLTGPCSPKRRPGLHNPLPAL